MRHIYLLILIFALIGCSKKEQVIFKGKIENPILNKFTIENPRDSFEVNIEEDGSFLLAFDKTKNNLYNFTYGKTKLKLLIIDTLEMCFNTKNINNTISFKGKYANFNNKLLDFMPGNSAPNFSLPDINDKLVSLSDFKGKYIYLDIWDSYCGPCIKEFSYHEKVYERFANRNIVFIGICMDKEKMSWIETIKKRNLKGIQLFNKGWKSDFTEKYLIDGIPRFILIDNNQKIIDIFAPKPSENIEVILKSLEDI